MDLLFSIRMVHGYLPTIGDFVLPTPEEGIMVENMIWAVDDTQNPVHLDCMVYLRQIGSGMKRRLILPLILRFFRSEIQI